jgi:hypothetical protein
MNSFIIINNDILKDDEMIVDEMNYLKKNNPEDTEYMKNYAPSSNPKLVDEYIDDIFEHLKEIEFINLPNSAYMKMQTDINEKMRAILIDWLVEVHLKF